MKRVLFTLFLILLLNPLDINAATATINKVWLEHGVNVNNRAAMKVHCRFTVQGMKGRTGNFCVWLKGPSGNWHNIRGNRTSSSGTPFFQWDYKPNYPDAQYDDFNVTTYLDDLNLLSGKNGYKVVVTIYDDKGNQIAQSNEVSFQGTGGARNNTPPARNQNSGNSVGAKPSNPVVNQWREEIGGGGFAIVQKYANGMTMRTNYRLCPDCRGSQRCSLCYGGGACSMCNGRGGIISAGYGTFIPCGGCNRTGRCRSCQGSGRCYCTKNGNPYPGYVIGGSTTYGPDGKVWNSDKVEYGRAGSKSSNSSRSGSNSSRSSKSSSASSSTDQYVRTTTGYHNNGSRMYTIKIMRTSSGEEYATISNYPNDKYHIVSNREKLANGLYVNYCIWVGSGWVYFN